MSVSIADASSTTEEVTFGQRVSRTVHIQLSEMTAELQLKFELPTSGSETLLSVNNVQVAAVGRNMPCHKHLQLTRTSVSQTSQDAALLFNLGRISNTGAQISSGLFPN